MEPLSKREEQVLLAVLNLEENAHLLAVRDHLSSITPMDWSVGIIHKPLLQLEKKGFITFRLGEATARRGGRRKKIYRITPRGLLALRALSLEQEKLWKNFRKLEISKSAG